MLTSCNDGMILCRLSIDGMFKSDTTLLRFPRTARTMHCVPNMGWKSGVKNDRLHINPLAAAAGVRASGLYLQNLMILCHHFRVEWTEWTDAQTLVSLCSAARNQTRLFVMMSGHGELDQRSCSSCPMTLLGDLGVLVGMLSELVRSVDAWSSHHDGKDTGCGGLTGHGVWWRLL